MDAIMLQQLPFSNGWLLEDDGQTVFFTDQDAKELHQLLPCGASYETCPCFQAGYQAGYEAKREPLP